MPDDPEERHIRAMIRSLGRAFAGGTPQVDLARLAGAVMGDEDTDAGQQAAESKAAETEAAEPRPTLSRELPQA